MNNNIGWCDTGVSTMTYIYTWCNNPKRVTMKGKLCKMIARGKLNSCCVEFENGQREIISRKAIKGR